MYAMFVAPHWYPHGGAADYYCTLEELTSDSLHQFFMDLIKDHIQGENYREDGFEGFVTALNLTTFERCGSDTTIEYGGRKISFTEMNAYEVVGGSNNIHLPMLPIADVIWELPRDEDGVPMEMDKSSYAFADLLRKQIR